jgi:hypothetical protein
VVWLLVQPLFSFDPSSGEELLFRIARSRDANEIFYTVNPDKNGFLNTENPITIYWLKRTEGNKTESLTWIQNKYAYGLHFLSITPTEAEFQFVSYSKRSFYLRKNKDGNFRVYTFAGETEIEVDKIFVQIDGGSFWFPKVSRVELHARKTECLTEIAEIINP